MHCYYFQMPTIKLQSSDGELFEVDVEIAKQSVTIKTMLEGKMINTFFILFFKTLSEVSSMFFRKC